MVSKRLAASDGADARPEQRKKKQARPIRPRPRIGRPWPIPRQQLETRERIVDVLDRLLASLKAGDEGTWARTVEAFTGGAAIGVSLEHALARFLLNASRREVGRSLVHVTADAWRRLFEVASSSGVPPGDIARPIGAWVLATAARDVARVAEIVKWHPASRGDWRKGEPDPSAEVTAPCDPASRYEVVGGAAAYEWLSDAGELLLENLGPEWDDVYPDDLVSAVLLDDAAFAEATDPGRRDEYEAIAKRVSEELATQRAAHEARCARGALVTANGKEFLREHRLPGPVSAIANRATAMRRRIDAAYEALAAEEQELEALEETLESATFEWSTERTDDRELDLFEAETPIAEWSGPSITTADPTNQRVARGEE